MKSGSSLQLLNRDADGGDEPTAAEREWWRDACKPDRRRHFGLWVPWITGMVLIPAAIRNPHAFFGGSWMWEVPLGLSAGAFGAYVGWRLASPSMFKLRLAGKRIRDALLAGP